MFLSYHIPWYMYIVVTITAFSGTPAYIGIFIIIAIQFTPRDVLLLCPRRRAVHAYKIIHVPMLYYYIVMELFHFDTYNLL